jgi:hypothetical protein
MRKVLLGGFLLATFAMTPVFAASTTTTTTTSHETIQGNELLFGSNSLTMPITFTPAFTINVNASVGYQRAVMANLQAGIRGSMGIATTAQAWNVAGWLTYNLDEKWTDSIFIGAGLGILQSQTAPNYYLDITVAAEVGKRFEICHGLTWRPNLTIGKVLNGADMTWTLNLVQLSYMW